MQILKNPPRDRWEALTARALAAKSAEVTSAVADIVAQVKERGDEALRDYELKFTGARLDSLCVSAQELDEAGSRISNELKEAIACDLPENVPVIFISSVSGYNIQKLKDLLWNMLQRENQESR